MTLSVNYRGGFAKLSDLGMLGNYEGLCGCPFFTFFFSLFSYYFSVISFKHRPQQRATKPIGWLWLTNQILELYKVRVLKRNLRKGLMPIKFLVLFNILNGF